MTQVFLCITSRALGFAFYLNPVSLYVYSHTVGCACRLGSENRGQGATYLDILGSGAFDLFETDSLFPFSLGRPNSSICLLCLTLSLPNLRTGGVVIAGNEGASFPAQPP